MNKHALLSAIRKDIERYCEAAHDFRFDPEAPVVRLHEPTFGADEIFAATECMLTTQVTMGRKVKTFEEEFAEKYGFAHGVMVNSGSSANLLAIAALANPDLKDSLRPGDEVIVPALSWSTTVWPLIQLGLTPVIVDIDPETLNIDPNEVERAIGPRTRAVMIVPVYGNPCDMDALTTICERHGLQLIEDCCEALGAFYRGRAVGSFGRVATFSFYYSHHMTTLEGGICLTQDFDLAELMRILRAHGWIREVQDPARWTARYPDINPRFLFVNVGYNLRATELQGAMGSVQLPKLDGFVATRRANAAWFAQALGAYAPVIRLQRETAHGHHSWFGIPVILRPSLKCEVHDIMAALGAKGIETRPIICGNVARQPGMRLYPHRVQGDLRHASEVMERGFSFGNHQAIDARARSHVAEALGVFLDAHAGA